MPKRFTGTEKWDKEWFQTLKPKHKCLWIFLCDRCDVAGIWESNFSLASFSIGEKITESDLKIFDQRIEKIAPGKFLIKNFIEYQYGKLSKDCKPHIPIIKILEKNNIDYETLSKGYTKGMDTLKEKEKEKDIEKEEEKENGVRVFEKKIISKELPPSQAMIQEVFMKHGLSSTDGEGFYKWVVGKHGWENINDWESYTASVISKKLTEKNSKGEILTIPKPK